jgi:queuine/archaeosine tRNA-ribosyltransferase
MHHLLMANELLFEVLLYAHNQFQTVRLFESARAAVEAEGGGADHVLDAWAAKYR